MARAVGVGVGVGVGVLVGGGVFDGARVGPGVAVTRTSTVEVIWPGFVGEQAVNRIKAIIAIYFMAGVYDLEEIQPNFIRF